MVSHNQRLELDELKFELRKAKLENKIKRQKLCDATESLDHNEELGAPQNLCQQILKLLPMCVVDYEQFFAVGNGYTHGPTPDEHGERSDEDIITVMPLLAVFIRKMYATLQEHRSEGIANPFFGSWRSEVTWICSALPRRRIV